MNQKAFHNSNMVLASELNRTAMPTSNSDLTSFYASLALGLKRTFQSSAEEIESIFDRIGELEYEEISAADIIERAKVEAGVDVGDLAKGTSI